MDCPALRRAFNVADARRRCNGMDNLRLRRCSSFDPISSDRFLPPQSRDGVWRFLPYELICPGTPVTRELEVGWRSIATTIIVVGSTRPSWSPRLTEQSMAKKYHDDIVSHIDAVVISFSSFLMVYKLLRFIRDHSRQGALTRAIVDE